MLISFLQLFFGVVFFDWMEDLDDLFHVRLLVLKRHKLYSPKSSF